MKKTLSLLAVAALVMGATPGFAKEIEVRPSIAYIQSATLGTTLASGATLINSETGRVVIYDMNDDPQVLPPFDITQGHIYWGFDLTNVYNKSIELDDLSADATDFAVRITEDDTLVLDFKKLNGGVGMGGPTEAEYVVIMFREITEKLNNFAEWYEENSVNITGRFNDGDYTAYVIAETCDMTDNATSYGGLVFFNNSVAPAVLAAETFPGAAVPEPATATLSLLALAGLAARRRRK